MRIKGSENVLRITELLLEFNVFFLNRSRRCLEGKTNII
jgi:hypothetical protein